MAKYLFTVNDVPLEPNKNISANEIVMQLLEHNLWLFAEKVPMLKRLKPEDKVLIYICGHGRRYFYCEIELKTPIKSYSEDSEPFNLAENLGLVWMTQYCEIKTLKIFKKPIYIKPLIEKLSFLTEKKNYGLNLRLPIILIPENDYKLIIDQDRSYSEINVK